MCEIEPDMVREVVLQNEELLQENEVLREQIKKRQKIIDGVVTAYPQLGKLIYDELFGG